MENAIRQLLQQHNGGLFFKELHEYMLELEQEGKITDYNTNDLFAIIDLSADMDWMTIYRGQRFIFIIGD